MLERLAGLFKRRRFDADVPRRSASRRAVGDVLAAGGVRPFDADIATALSRLRALSRHAAENDAYAIRTIKLAQAHVVGPKGLRLRLDGRHAEPVRRAWEAHSRCGRFDATGGLSRGAVERLLVAGLFMDGEGFAELLPDGRVDVVDAARVPLDVWAAPRLRMGIEYDGRRRPVRYAVQSIHSDRQGYSLATYRRDDAVWIPASDMAHVFDRDRFPEASRGVPRLAAAVSDGEALRQYRSAELASAKAQAKNRGFLVDSSEGRSSPRSDARRVNAGGAAQTSAVVEDDLDDDTLLYRLPNGVGFTDATTRHPNPQFADFNEAMLRAFSSATGAGYSALSNDVGGANFSSLRAERLVQQTMYAQDKELIAESFTRPVFARWLRSALMDGTLAEVPLSAFSEIVETVEFEAPAQQHIQPEREEQARRTRIELGLTSPQQEIASMGGDPERVLRERREWRESERMMIA